MDDILILVATRTINWRLLMFHFSRCLPGVDCRQVDYVYIKTGLWDIRHESLLVDYIREADSPRIVEAFLKSSDYLDVMRVKRDYLVNEEVPKDTIVCLWDDDYLVNPHVFKWIRWVFDKYSPRYATPIWTGSSEIVRVVNPCEGPPLFARSSALGGSIVTRAGTFVSDFDAYCSRPSPDPMFDRGFWRFVATRYDMPHPVLTAGGYSLIQHLDYGSYYKEGGHMGGIEFMMYDPFVKWEVPE